jgi:hypothetical protein
MNSGRTVFAQLIEHLPHKEFHKCVTRYRGNRYAKNFSCWDQYLAMVFAQLTYRECLRDIKTTWPIPTRPERLHAKEETGNACQIGNGKSASVHECVRCRRYDLVRMSLDENGA